MNKILSRYINNIQSVNQEAKSEAKTRLDSLIKPPGSLGKLEDIAIKISGITGKLKNTVEKKCVIIMCSDNGVVEEGVSSAPQEITLSMATNFIKGVTGTAVLARCCNADLKVYDVGINSDSKIFGVIDKKIRKSTCNIKLGAAMSYAEAEQAFLTGVYAIRDAKQEGHQLIGVGEMGIGNTTTATAILCKLMCISAEKVTGRGAGLNHQAHINKINVIDAAVKINTSNINDPIDVIAKLGGFDIAAMTGAFIGAAYYRIPVVVDGYISITAAYLATLLSPKVKDYMFLSHISEEPGYLIYMDMIGLEAPLNMNMRLGEGSGCHIMFDVIKAACAVMNNMATFDEVMTQAGKEYLANL